MASNYYVMECCFEHQKTRIIEECDLMGCEGKHHFQEYFIEKKYDRKKTFSQLVFIILTEDNQESIGVALKQKERHSALNTAIVVKLVLIFLKIFRNCKNHIFSLQEKIWIINQLPGEFFLNSQNIILILDQKQLKQSKVISCVIKQGSMSNAFLS